MCYYPLYFHVIILKHEQLNVTVTGQHHYEKTGRKLRSKSHSEKRIVKWVETDELWKMKDLFQKKQQRKAVEDVWEVKHKRNNYTSSTLDSTSDLSLIVNLFVQVY